MHTSPFECYSFKPSVAKHCCKKSKHTTDKETVRVLFPNKTLSFEAWRTERQNRECRRSSERRYISREKNRKISCSEVSLPASARPSGKGRLEKKGKPLGTEEVKAMGSGICYEQSKGTVALLLLSSEIFILA
jgi:hypothetical protein